MDTMTHIHQFKSDGIELLAKLNQKQLERLLITTNDAYYNNHPLLTDNEFDIISHIFVVEFFLTDPYNGFSK